MHRDTIFALSSGRPPAAIGIVRVSGPHAHEAGRLLTGPLPDARMASVRELRDPATAELIDEALILRFDAPASATGENVIELHCHGGRAVVDALLTVLGSMDELRPAEPGEFTRRAFENGRIDLTEAEGLADLLEAETETQRKAALALSEGGLRRQIEAWQERVIGLSAVAERAIDYDEDDEPVDARLLQGCADLSAELREWLSRPRIEVLKDGVKVVVAGPPNAGKSSLINVIAGTERAIVTDVPGTTRDHIEVPLSIAGLPILLTDTAGLRVTSDVVESIGVRRAEQLVRGADVLLWLGDPCDAPHHPELILVHSRADVLARRDVPVGSLAVSSLTQQGLPELLERMVLKARKVLPAPDAIALNRRQAEHLLEAAEALDRGAVGRDPLIVAEDIRQARTAFNHLSGRAGVDEVLSALFGRFCLGK